MRVPGGLLFFVAVPICIGLVVRTEIISRPQGELALRPTAVAMPTLQPQTVAAPTASFEVASIKLADPNAPIKGPVCHGTTTPNQTPVGLGRCQFIGMTLQQLINT